MSAKTKIIVIRKSQLAFALVILVIALLLAGLIISAIVTQVCHPSDAESDTSISADAHSTAANSDASGSAETTAASATDNTSEATSTASSSDQTDTAASSTSSGQADTAASSTSSGQADTAASSTSSGQYTPGVYTSTVILDDAAMDVQVVVDASHINSISLVNLDESVAASYPLVEPAIEDLAEQIVSNQSVDDVTYSSSNQYTSMVLYNAICDALEKASSS